MTLTDVTTRTGNLPANFSDDPYLDYGIEAATAGANFLKFSRDGQGFTYGMDGTPLPLGTKLAANMAGVRVGWLKWVDGKPEKVLSLVTERRKISRDELGDNDPALWEMPGQDPWKQAAELELVDGSGAAIHLLHLLLRRHQGGEKALLRLRPRAALQARPGAPGGTRASTGTRTPSSAKSGNRISRSSTGWTRRRSPRRGSRPMGEAEQTDPFDLDAHSGKHRRTASGKTRRNSGQEAGARLKSQNPAVLAEGDGRSWANLMPIAPSAQRRQTKPPPPLAWRQGGGGPHERTGLTPRRRRPFNARTSPMRDANYTETIEFLSAFFRDTEQAVELRALRNNGGATQAAIHPQPRRSRRLLPALRRARLGALLRACYAGQPEPRRQTREPARTSLPVGGNRHPQVRHVCRAGGRDIARLPAAAVPDRVVRPRLARLLVIVAAAAR